MFPSASEALTLTTLTDLVRWYNVDPAVWNAFVGQVGDPTDDYRLRRWWRLPARMQRRLLGST